MPRNRVLDEMKRREICALLTAGMQLHKVARYVGCTPKTIQRERKLNEEFDQQVRRAQMAADLNPLEAMRRAAGTHWRAAAWMLERDERRRARRVKQNTFQRRQIEAFADDLVRTIRQELDYTNTGNPILADRVVTRVEETFRQSLGVTPPKSSTNFDWQLSAKFLEQRYEATNNLLDMASPSVTPEEIPRPIAAGRQEPPSNVGPEGVIRGAQEGTKQTANCPLVNEQ